MKLIGIILIVFGVFGLGFGGFHYTQREKVIDTKNLQVSTQQEKTLPITPLAGFIAIIAGVALLVGSKDRKG